MTDGSNWFHMREQHWLQAFWKKEESDGVNGGEMVERGSSLMSGTCGGWSVEVDEGWVKVEAY